MTIITKNLKAEDIMTAEPVCVEASMTIRELARLFAQNEISGAPVVDSQGLVLGIVSKTDLIRRCTEGTLDVPPAYLFEAMSEQSDEDFEQTPESRICVQDFMTEDPMTVTAETPAGEIARLMFEGRFHRVIVIDSQRFPIGIITGMDMLGAFPR